MITYKAFMVISAFTCIGMVLFGIYKICDYVDKLNADIRRMRNGRG